MDIFFETCSYLMSERYLNREARCQVSPGIPGRVQTGCWSAPAVSAVLQCCSAADSGWCAGRWCSQPDTASLSFISLMQTPTPGGTLSWNWGEWVGWLGNPSLSGFYYSSRPLNNKGLYNSMVYYQLSGKQEILIRHFVHQYLHLTFRRIQHPKMKNYSVELARTIV